MAILTAGPLLALPAGPAPRATRGLPAGGGRAPSPPARGPREPLGKPPAPPGVDGLDGIQRADDLVVAPPEVLIGIETPIGDEFAGSEGVEGLVKVGAHLGDPLGNQPFWNDHERPTHEPPELEFPHDET